MTLISTAKLIACQSEFLPRVEEVRAGLDVLEHVIVTDGEGGTATLDHVARAGASDFDFDAAWKAVDAEDLVTIIYTSGTTGPPYAGATATIPRADVPNGSHSGCEWLHRRWPKRGAAEARGFRER